VSDFADREGVALVTGGTGGIGAAIVRLLIARGSRVAFTYRRNAEAAAALEAESARARGYPVDLGDAGQVRAVLSEIGALHTLVYASGPHVPMVHLSRVPPERFREQLESDTTGFFTLVQQAIPLLRESNGSIVAVTTAANRRFPVRGGFCRQLQQMRIRDSVRSGVHSGLWFSCSA
jgi:NAD(P)-dependent dehydrogenase (short-subunit alcohol dehydrogenase family)